MSPSPQAKLADRMIFMFNELSTRTPRPSQLRGQLAKLGLDPGPRISDAYGIRRMLDRSDFIRIGEPPASRPVTIGGVPCHIFGDANAQQTMLYFHGGAFIAGSLKSHGVLAQEMAARTGMRVVWVDYRMGPEHRHPAALDDVYAVYKAIIHQGDHENGIVLAGDSAGGNLAFALTLKCILNNDATPRACVGLSPASDLTFSGESMTSNFATDGMLCKSDLEWMCSHYHTVEQADTDPLLSPQLAKPAWLKKFPPVLIQVSDREVLLDDARTFAAMLDRAGGSVTLDIWHGLPHVWHSLVGIVPEADQAINAIADWLRGPV